MAEELAPEDYARMVTIAPDNPPAPELLELWAGKAGQALSETTRRTVLARHHTNRAILDENDATFFAEQAARGLSRTETYNELARQRTRAAQRHRIRAGQLSQPPR